MAPYLSHPARPVAFALSKSISYMLPETAQAYYDIVLEPMLSASGVQSSFVQLRSAMPESAFIVGILLADFLVCAGLAVFIGLSTLGACAKVMTTVAVLAVCRLALVRRALKRAGGVSRT